MGLGNYINSSSGVKFRRGENSAPGLTGIAGRRPFMIIFVENKLLTERENLEENLKIEEMATLRKNDSGLPANLYLDDTGSWSNSGHWKRIKFQPDTGDRPVTRNMVPMSISDSPRVLVKNVKLALDAKQLDRIKAFVRANKDLLLQLADAKISILEFGRRMVKV
jgi:hypothetical protein